MRPSRRSADDGERGSASVEFLTVGMLLLVPTVPVGTGTKLDSIS